MYNSYDVTASCSRVMSSTAFSSDGQEALSRQVESTHPQRPSTAGGENEKELRRYFEIARCVEFIKSDTNLQRVALQFPDFLLHDAARVTSLLSKETGASLFVLGDTSYGSCCVDEVAAEHVQADGIIHFGPGCLTQTRRLPVLYVFGRETVDVLHCVTVFRELYPDRQADILVLYDTVYAHCVDGFTSHVSSEYPNCVVSSLVLPEPVQHRSGSGDVKGMCACSCGGQERGMCSSTLSNKAKTAAAMDDTLAAERSTTHGYLADQPPQRRGDKTSVALEQTKEHLSIEEENVGVEEFPEDQQDAADPQRHKHARFGRTFVLRKPVEEYQMFYIGFEGPTLTNLILNYNRCQFCSYNPTTRQSRKETINVNKALGRRYFLVQKAKEARRVGILVGTLGAADYLGIMERLKKILKQAQKKYYTIAVGKLNVAKMANFLEIDIFVLVACPENSLVDSQDFYKPVVTPYEMEVACLRSRDWSGDCVTDYQELFPGAAFHVQVDENTKPEEPEYSLITGGLLPSQLNYEERGTQAGALVPRSKMEVALQSSAAEYLQSRSWQGLKQRLGESKVSTAVEGTTGIAAAYTHESEYNLKSTAQS